VKQCAVMPLLRVAVGMSSGVDSAVSALILSKMRRRFELVGCFMRNWDTADETGHCRADKEAEEAEDICSRLGIPFRQVDLVKDYWNDVFEPLVAGYERGLTPSPDIACNRSIKFGVFHDFCTERVGCDLVATGHYARTSRFSDDDLEERVDFAPPVRLLKSADLVKDQTYFLSQVPQSALARTLFPVGGLTKDTVKRIASENGLDDVAKRKESMGICFIGKRGNRKTGFQNFMKHYVEPKSGDLVDVDTGAVVGRHNGVHNFTLGQRLRLRGMRDKVFAAGKYVDENVIYVCFGSDHPSLFCDKFYVRAPLHWIAGAGPTEGDLEKGFRCQFRSQNKRPLTSCLLRGSDAPQEIVVECVEPERAMCPGQIAAFYREDECLGSAVIAGNDHLGQRATFPSSSSSSTGEDHKTRREAT